MIRAPVKATDVGSLRQLLLLVLETLVVAIEIFVHFSEKIICFEVENAHIA